MNLADYTVAILHIYLLWLQHPTHIVQRKPDPSREPCTVVWDVVWDDLMTVQLRNGKKDPPGSPPSRVILTIHHSPQESRIFESKETLRVIKCHRESRQAEEIRSAIQQVRNTYGPSHSVVQSQALEKKMARKPYAGVGAGTGASAGAALGLLTGMAAPITIPVMATFGALLGTASGQSMFDTDPDSIKNHDTKRGQQKDMECALSVPNSSYNKSASGKFINELTLVWSDKVCVFQDF
ncbi:hypothetical protein KI387_027863 [Taxus chinensis]|uniref:Uncharacterized protein n=1 Tax=Taxus chinensis TaxID=29808 RepID=A0AA38L2L8_TAXCH|nr:hypothetical protein KI387_027863 [Taxus chinensis]